MTIGSLFSGYGGLDLAAAEFFGASVAWHAEIDPAACRVLKARFPGVPNLGDITTVDWSRVEPVDVLTGGFPCQDVSHAGLRAGVRQGTRSGLWFEMARAIDALRPQIVVIENVSGLLSADAACDVEPCPWCLGDEPSGHMRALGAVLADLAEIGFDAEWASVRASDCGAAHRRERVFIVAAPHAGSGQLTRVAIGADRLPEPAERRDESVALLPTPAVNDMGAGKTVEQWDNWTDAMRAKHGNGNGHGKSLEIEAQRLLPTPRATDGEKGGPNQTNGRGVRDSLPGVVTTIEEGTSDATSICETGPGEVLRGLRSTDAPQAVRTIANTGGHGPVPEPSNVRTVMREHEEGRYEERSALAGQEAPQAELRGVRDGQRPARTPHRQEPCEQRPGQPADALLVMPPETALAGGPRQADARSGEGACDGCGAWGPYAPAVHRWEVRLGRLAPPPTELNKDGRHRLSPLAVEFMMGLPEGWVTDTGIPRNAQLKALGNGVVPQQAALALSILLPRLAS